MLKRGQFFLLAAVIISAVIISLGFVANKATVNREPGSFSDFSYEVKREAGAVIDYEIYTLSSEGDLEDFIDLLSDDIRDKEPDANFVFIYGSGDIMKIKNKGSESVFVGGEEVEGSGAIIIGQICNDGGCTLVPGFKADYDPVAGTGTMNISSVSEIPVTIGDYEYFFPKSDYKQVIFIIQKETEDGNFVSIK